MKFINQASKTNGNLVPHYESRPKTDAAGTPSFSHFISSFCQYPFRSSPTPAFYVTVVFFVFCRQCHRRQRKPRDAATSVAADPPPRGRCCLAGSVPLGLSLPASFSSSAAFHRPIASHGSPSSSRSHPGCRASGRFILASRGINGTDRNACKTYSAPHFIRRRRSTHAPEDSLRAPARCLWHGPQHGQRARVFSAY